MKNWLTDRTITGNLRGQKLRIAVHAVCVAGFTFFGYNQGLMGGLLNDEDFNYEFPATKNNSIIQGSVTAAFAGGCFLGAFFVLFKGERIGRRPLIVLGSIIMTIGSVISTTPFRPHWPLGQFVIGRVITGIGNGFNTAVIPVWQSEIAQGANRGILCNMDGAVIALGTFVAYWINFGLSYAHGSVKWRFPMALQIFLALLVFIGILRLPESPRWLIANNRIQEARVVLGKLWDKDPEDEWITAEIEVISNASTSNKLQFRELLSGGKTQHFQRMIIGASTQFFQQFTGCNAAIYYSTLLFYDTIFNRSKYRLSMILGGVFATIYTISTIPSFFLIDTLGRRKLFLIGAIGQGCSFIICFACLVKPTTTNAKGAAVGIYLFIVFFAFTILPVPWLYPPEINPSRTRTLASAISTCVNWLGNFAVVLFVPKFMEKSSWGCYLFFAAINFLFVPVIYFFYPETKGRELEEIDIIFAKAYVEHKPPYRVAAAMPKLTLEEINQHGSNLGLFDRVPVNGQTSEGSDASLKGTSEQV